LPPREFLEIVQWNIFQKSTGLVFDYTLIECELATSSSRSYVRFCVAVYRELQQGVDASRIVYMRNVSCLREVDFRRKACRNSFYWESALSTTFVE
jgi:hypothetical protein